jgi:hypothetical protein
MLTAVKWDSFAEDHRQSQNLTMCGGFSESPDLGASTSGAGSIMFNGEPGVKM